MHDPFDFDVKTFEAQKKKMDEDPVYNAMVREMELVESEIWFNVNIKNEVTPMEIEGAKRSVKDARTQIFEKYKKVSKVTRTDPKKKEDIIPILQNILNDSNMVPQDDFGKLEDLIESEGGVNVKRFRDRKVTKRDIKNLMEELDTEEYQQLAKNVDKLFDKDTWKSLGLDGNQSDKMEDHQVQNLKHMMKKEMQKHPDHAELLETQYGKPFEKVMDDFEEYNKNL
jgi:hypothetical protein